MHGYKVWAIHVSLHVMLTIHSCKHLSHGMQGFDNTMHCWKTIHHSHDS